MFFLFSERFPSGRRPLRSHSTGDYATQSYTSIVRIPSWTDQDSMECHKVFEAQVGLVGHMMYKTWLVMRAFWTPPFFKNFPFKCSCLFQNHEKTPPLWKWRPFKKPLIICFSCLHFLRLSNPGLSYLPRISRQPWGVDRARWHNNRAIRWIGAPPPRMLARQQQDDMNPNLNLYLPLEILGGGGSSKPQVWFLSWEFCFVFQAGLLLKCSATKLAL